jgi:RNA polymerase sigma factor (sigma-70 family)
MSILRQYVQTRSETAFKSLVDRYINIVYAAARRQTGDSHLAEDVTQAVFIVLAQRAGQIPSDRELCPWLLRTTCYCASTARRARDRRNRFENRAAAMSQNQARGDDGDEWEDVAPLLDEGLSRLRPKDRDVLLWRFFESRTAAQIGQMLGISEHAASKRVSRAIDRLRDFFTRRGVTVSGAALGGMLAVKVSEAAPAGLVGAVSSAATLGGAGTSAAAIAKGALLMGVTAKVKAAAVAAVVALLLGAGAIATIQSLARVPSTLVMAQSPPVAPPAAAPTAAPAATQGASPNAVTFASGPTVQLLGLAEGHDNTTAAWWGTDGLPIPAPNYPDTVQFSVPANKGYRKIQFKILVSPVPQDADLTINFSPNGGSATTSHPLPDGGRIYRIGTTVLDSLASADLNIGYATGPWERYTLWEKTAGPVPTTAPVVPYRVQRITREKDDTAVHVLVVTVKGRGQNQRVFATLAGGETIFPTHSEGTSNAYRIHFKCPMDQIQTIQFETRPYEWSAIKNVSLIALPNQGL